MTVSLVALAFLMWVVTYPSRAVPLLAPGIDRLPSWALAYLRLVGPAVLASLAAVNCLVVTDPDGGHSVHAGAAALGVLVCLGLVAWRRNLFLGLAAAVICVLLSRALGLA